MQPLKPISIKKILLFVSAVSTALSIFAQTETLIGTTTYDLQTNGSLGSRIINNSGVTIQSIWMFGNFPAIGTGYNFLNGNSWGAAPDSSIEAPTKTGFPVIVNVSNGSEIVFAHDSLAKGLVKSTRDSIGSGNWTISFLNELQPSVSYPKAATGGPDGNTIHLIAYNNSSYGRLFYSRSPDGGVNWDIKSVQIPGIDATNYSYLPPENYAIAANGNIVAVVIFGQLNKTIIAKSTNNGVSWTSKQVSNIPFKYNADYPDTSGIIIGISDLNGDYIADTVENTDGSGALIIDDSGTAHIFYGVMKYYDDAPGDGSWGYSDTANGIGYWNENMGNSPPQIIARALDIDGSGIVLDEYANGIEIAQYYSSLTTMPSAGINSNGCMYVVYSGIVETLNSGFQFYRHIYGIKSCDGGCTWSYPIDLTPNDDWAECVFPAIAHRVDLNFYFIYQKDPEPGLNMKGDWDMIGINEIRYVKVPVTKLDTIIGSTVNCGVGINEFSKENLQNELLVFPNPNNGNFSVISPQSIKIYNVLGEIVYTLSPTPLLEERGEGIMLIDLSKHGSGIYFIQVSTEGKTMSKKLIIE